MSKKTALLSCRLTPSVREALEIAAQRDRRSLSNYVEGAVILALPADLRAKVGEVAERDQEPFDGAPASSK